jgi:hypothetical protein
VLHENVPFDQREIRVMAAYGAALKAAKAGRPAGLRSFQGVRVRDVFGTEYTLLTDINAYLRAEQIHGEADPMDFFQSGELVVAPPSLPAAA